MSANGASVQALTRTAVETRGTTLGAAVAGEAGKLSADTIEQVLLSGDIARLTPKQKVDYYLRVCDTLGLNPATTPFEFIMLNGKLRFYATKACTEQLRKINGVSITIASREEVAGCYVVTASATDKWGRCDESIGAVPIENLKGESRSNAMMKAETKAKRRVTLSICGLGLLDESEVDSIPGATAVRVPIAAVEAARAEVVPPAPKAEPVPVPSAAPSVAAETASGTDSKTSASDGTATSDTGEAPDETVISGIRQAVKALTWKPSYARIWLDGAFGVQKVDALTARQAADALQLLEACQVDDGDATYQAVRAKLAAEGRVKAAP